MTRDVLAGGRGAFLLLALVLITPSGAAAEEDTSTVDGRTAAEWAADLGSPDLDGRRKAAFTLWKFGTRARPHVRALATALRDHDAYVRSTVEKVLVRFEWQRSLNTLATALPELIAALGDTRASVRLAAANLIWNAGPIPNVVGGDPPPKELLPALVKALEDEDAGVRANAAAALANLQAKATAALPALEKALRDDDAKVRLWSVRAVAWVGREKGLASVLPLVGDADAGVRTAVLEACAAARGEDAEAALAALRTGLEDEAKAVRRTAANSLWGLGRVEALGDLARTLREDEEPEVRGVAAMALGGLGDPAAVPHLLQALERKDDPTLAGAATGLAQVGPEGLVAVPRLIELLRAGSNTLRASVAMSLGMMGAGAEAALPALIEALEDEDAGVRAGAASTLASLSSAGVHSDAMRAAVAKRINDDSPQVRQYCVGVVYDLGPAMALAVPALLELHASGAEHVGDRLVFNALRRIGPTAKDALPVLREALAQEGDGRVPAAAAIAGISTDAKEIDRAVQVLIDALTHERSRADGFYQLEEVGPRAKRAALIMRVWMKRDSGWRLTAAGALLHMEGAAAQDAVDTLVSALGEKDLASQAMRQINGLSPETLSAFRDPMLGLAAEPSSRWQSGALAALVKMGAHGTDVRKIYAAARKDKTPYVRTLGARGLAALDKAAAPK